MIFDNQLQITNDTWQLLQGDPEYIELDKRGHQMYSAGLNNYLRFIDGSDFYKYASSIRALDIPIPAPIPSMKQGKVVWPLSPIVKHQSLELAGYECEVNSTHLTFTDEQTQHSYMEGHHIIPVNKQLQFKYNLDVFANIVCLCPVCHRLLHNAIKIEKDPILEKIYFQRANRLADSGIKLSRTEFIDIVS